jgi:hypothetical protein
MDEFALIFRQSSDVPIPSEAELKSIMKEWDEWISAMAAEGRYIPGGRLTQKGKVLRTSGAITDGPFVEMKEELAGFFIVKARDIDQATTLAHGCPILKMKGGSVEIRPIVRGKIPE